MRQCDAVYPRTSHGKEQSGEAPNLSWISYRMWKNAKPLEQIINKNNNLSGLSHIKSDHSKRLAAHHLL